MGLQLILEEFKSGLRPNDGMKVVPEGHSRWQAEHWWSLDWWRTIYGPVGALRNEWIADVVGDSAAVHEPVGCGQSATVGWWDFEGDVEVNRQPVQLPQTFRAVKDGIEENEFGWIILGVPKEVDKWVAVVQRRGDQTACKSRSRVDGEERTEGSDGPDEVAAWFYYRDGTLFKAEAGVRGDAEILINQ